jgi:putative PIN family toxin of toxin-antitoxin system
MRVVLDTNVLVRATKSAAGPARKLLANLSSAPHAIVTSSGLLAELMRVLEYPRLRAQHRLSRMEIEAFIGELFRIAEVVPLQPGKIGTTVPADPEDDLVIRTAVEGKADVICTLDHHFQHPAARAFLCATRHSNTQRRGASANTGQSLSLSRKRACAWN